MASIEENKRGIAIELFVLSLAALFVELLMIRWLASDVRAFTVFRTFPLVTCFVGMGAGYSAGSDRAFRWAPLAMAFTMLVLKVSEYAGIDYWRFPAASVFNWQVLSAGDQSIGFLFQCMLALTVLLAAPFAICYCIATRLGVLFNSMKPLTAYSLNLGGSFVGSVVFALCSYFGLTPAVLLTCVGIIVAFYLAKSSSRAWQWALPLILIPALSFWHAGKESTPLIAGLTKYQNESTTTYWSPYQRIDVNLYHDKADKKFLGLELGVNRAFYQYFLNDAIPSEKLPDDLRSLFLGRRQFYGLPFTLQKPTDVLVVGAGTGQNVAAALDNGAGYVDAVDIDPNILAIGKLYNPKYSSPKVNLVCDDARHFFGHSEHKYDLIVFTFLDSQAVVGNGSSVRLDAYVYTEESFRQSIKLLKPNGIVAVSYAVFMPWMGERLYKTMESAAGYPPLVLNLGRGGNKVTTFFLLGQPIKDKTLNIADVWQKASFNAPESTRKLTDDWPYLYVRTDVVDVPYLLVVFEILLISIICGRKLAAGQSDPGNWQMFFLGSAFLLLELHAISLLSLLFGSTWLTSAIVINCILLMIFAANLFVIKCGASLYKFVPQIYTLLFLSILASYQLPTQRILDGLDFSVASAIISFLTVLPLGIAGVIFACSFSQRMDSAKALAFNLYGALAGGLLEYLSNYTGIKGLELVGLALYALSFLCYRLPKRQQELQA